MVCVCLGLGVGLDEPWMLWDMVMEGEVHSPYSSPLDLLLPDPSPCASGYWGALLRLPTLITLSTYGD